MKFVTIDGKQQPISFNMAAYLECEEELDMPIYTLLTQSDSIHPSKYVKLAYLGLRFGCDEYGRKPPMTYSGFVDYVNKDNDCIKEIMAIVFKDIETIVTIQAEQFKMVTGEKEESDTKKKKVSGRSTSGA